MGEIELHTHAVELGYHAPPKTRKTGIGRLDAPVPKQVALVIGELNDPKTKPEKDLDQSDIIFQDRPILGGEDKADLALLLEAAYIVHRGHDGETRFVADQGVVGFTATNRLTRIFRNPRDGHLQRGDTRHSQTLVPSLTKERGAVNHDGVPMQGLCMFCVAGHVSSPNSLRLKARLVGLSGHVSVGHPGRIVAPQYPRHKPLGSAPGSCSRVTSLLEPIAHGAVQWKNSESE